MENEMKDLWIDKYRPTKLDDYVLDPGIKQYFADMIKSGNIQNFSMVACQGSGKTTLARIIAYSVKAETLFVKCATDGSIDTLRSKVEPFCNAMTMDGRPKIVILDEIDSASSTGDSSFQKGLRTLIEAAQQDTRFILTANYDKILPAVLSRCPTIPLKFSKKDLLERVRSILDAEKVKYERESLKAFIEESFGFYPDCRRIINYLQFCCSSGELVVRLSKVTDAGKANFLAELVKKTFSAEKLLDVRQFYMRNKENVSDYVGFGSDLYNYVIDNDLISEDGVLRLTDMLRDLNVVIDKEAGFFGMVVAVRKYAKK